MQEVLVIVGLVVAIISMAITFVLSVSTLGDVAPPSGFGVAGGSPADTSPTDTSR